MVLDVCKKLLSHKSAQDLAAMLNDKTDRYLCFIDHTYELRMAETSNRDP
jgi:hypothetical protein